MAAAFRWPLRWLVLPTVVMLVLVAVLYAVITWPLAEDLRRTARLRVEQDSQLLANRLSLGISRRMTEMEQLARLLHGFRPEDAASLRQELAWLQSRSDAYAWLALVGPDGEVLAGTQGWLEGRSLRGRPVFEQGAKQVWFGEFHAAVMLRPHLAEPAQPEPWVADVAAPVHSRDGTLRGVLVAHLRDRWVHQLGDETLGLQRQQALALRWALLQSDGHALTSRNLPLPAGAASAVAGATDAGTEISGDRLLALRPLRLADLPELNWRVLVTQDLDVAMAPVQRLHRVLATFALLTLGVAAAAGLWMKRLAMQPVQAELDATRRRADASERRLTLLVNSALNDAFVTLDDAGRVLDWSQGASHLSGYAAAELQGQDWRRLLVDADGAAALLTQARHAGELALACQMRRADGHTFFARGRLYAWREGEARFALLFSDASQAQQAAQELAESEARLTAVVSSASDAIITTELDGRVQLFNPAAERIFGIAQADMLGQSLERLLPLEARPGHAAHMAGFAQGEVSRRPMGIGKVAGLRSDGERLVLEASIAHAQVGGRTLLTAILRDVSERVRAERRLVDYQVQLAGLTQRLLVQEKETTRKLAQSLHDELGQTLAALRLLIDAGRHGAAATQPWPAWMTRVDSLVDTANRQVRQVLMELRPPLLDDQGLHAALDNELQQLRPHHEAVALRLDWRAAPGQRWSADVEYAFFMVAREALGNALRHARARAIRLQVQGDASGLQLRVQDDGQGDTGLAQRVRPGHLGLVGMRERALAIGARLDLRSGSAEGTQVTISWGDGEWGEGDEPLVSD